MAREAQEQTGDDAGDQRTLTDAAFAAFRAGRRPRPPNLAVMKNEDERLRMSAEDASSWRDGTGERSDAGREWLGDEWIGREHLWVVRTEDVVHAHKTCEFGLARVRKEITHTNLTGGDDAFVGGELMLLGGNMVVINGDSGRYGTRDDAETEEVARAFAASGWTTYWVGLDEDLGRPAPLVGSPMRPVA